MRYEDFPKRLPRSSLQHDVPICSAGCATPWNPHPIPFKVSRITTTETSRSSWIQKLNNYQCSTAISIAWTTLSQPGSFNPGLPDIAGPYLISFHLCHLGFRVNLNPEVPWLIFGFLESSSKLPICFFLSPSGWSFRGPLALPRPFLRVKA